MKNKIKIFKIFLFISINKQIRILQHLKKNLLSHDITNLFFFKLNLFILINNLI